MYRDSNTCNPDWLLTPQRVAIHLPTGTGVVADLHLGYDGARRRAGEAVPARGLEDVLAGLRAALAHHGVHRLVIAGDLFENGRQARELSTRLIQWLSDAGVDLVGVVPGNHDGNLEEMLGSACCRDGVRLGPWRVVHGDGRLPRGQVVHGHLHPCLRWGDVVAPCYLVGARRLVLPAFSADAAGGNVLGIPAWRSYCCYAIAGEQVLDFGEVGGLSARRRLRLRARR